ncbi:unnamed protein product [Orchesella dallaii]|uniref:Uncharacterized protein n=1 Tax=Orchesella dallaii TaxID=48710 RepID=A0ABP1R842_9HEXA
MDRATCLKDIKEGMKETGFFGFLQSREYLWETMLPRESSFVIFAESVVVAIRFDGAPHNNNKLAVEQVGRN